MSRTYNKEKSVSFVSGNESPRTGIEAAPQTSQEINDFFVENKWIMYAVTRPYKGTQEYEDLFQEACVGVIKGINTFTPAKGVKLTTYVYVCAANEVKMCIRRNNAKKRSAAVVSIETGASSWSEEEAKSLIIQDPKANTEKEAHENVLYKQIMEIVRTELSGAEQLAVLRFQEGIPQSKIAKELKISQSQVSKMLRQAFCKVRAKLPFLMA